MQTESGIFLKKTWFIENKKRKIEDYYDFDPKKIIGK